MTVSSAPPTFSYQELPGDCRLAVNENRKMKTVSVLVCFAGNLDDTATRKSLLPALLRRGTRTRPDMQAINRFLEGLYGTSIGTAVQKVGEWHMVRFRLDVVNERFIPGEDGVLRRGLEFLRELLIDPLEIDGGFHPGFLEQEKKNLERSIRSLVDHKGAFAEHRLIEEMCRHEPYRLHEQGRVEDIASISALSLREFHREWAARHPLYVYVTGDIDAVQARDLVRESLLDRFAGREGGYALNPLPAPVPVGDVREVKERMDVQQAKLVLGFRHGVTYVDDAYEALLVMNGILGGFSHSKLFQNVREKASLAYSVHSGLERTKGLLLVSAGIAPENYEKAIDIILAQLRELQEGRVTDEELQATVSTLLNQNVMLEDNLPFLCDVDFIWTLHGRQLDLVALRERLEAVSKDDVVAVARRLRHDTTYLLSP